jgi:transcription elongation factor GreA
MLLQEPKIRIEQRERVQRGAVTDAVPLTAAARRALARELAHLRDEKLRDIPTRLRIAREFGDASSNDEYLAIREEEAVLDARIARLEDILIRATVIDPAGAHDSVVVGSEVELIDVDNGEKRNYVIESAHGALGRMTVSRNSPVGRALLGRRAGDRVFVELPGGRGRELELCAVRAPQGA